MAKLTIWQDHQLKQKIEQCTHGYKARYRKDSVLLFPVADILLDFYKGAVHSADFHGMESLENLYREYQETCGGKGTLNLSLEEIINQGYISVYMGRWETSLWHSSVFEKEELTEYPQGEILRFLLWLNEHPLGHKSCMEIVEPQRILDKWRMVCAEVPEVDWFVGKSYLELINGRYYAINGHGWDQNVDRALAKLWEHWGTEQFEKWLPCARCVSGTEGIFAFLGTESGKTLLRMLVQEVLYRYEVPSLEVRNRWYEMVRILESPKYARNPEEYREIGLWKGNRVFDVHAYERYGFEAELWYRTHADDFHLVLFSIIKHMDLLRSEASEKLAGYLNQYDWLGAMHECYGIGSDSLCELLTNGDTFFLGFRHLVRADLGDKRDSQGQAEMVLAVLQELFASGVKCQGYLRGEEIGSCLLYLFHEHKMTGRNGRNPYYMTILKGFVELLGTRECLEAMETELYEYMSSLLSIKNTVDWCTGFHLVLFCSEQWFSQNERLRRLKLFEQWKCLIWEGYRKIFCEKSEYATFIEVKYFTEGICADIFKEYIASETLGEQIKRLIPVSMTAERDKTNVLKHRYKLLLHILYQMYVGLESSPPVVKMSITDVLKAVLLGETKIFDYAYVQIFSSEEALNACLSVLTSADDQDCALMEELIKEPMPDLLIYYHAVKDETFKEMLHAAITERATEDSLHVFHGTRAIELVLQYKLVALYPAAKKEVNHWLETWKKRGASERADYVERARMLLCWLKYVQGEYRDILEGDNRFYQAVIYMDVEEFLDLKHAGEIWREMIEEQGIRKYGGGVYLNYMLVLARQMENWANLSAGEKDELNETFQWLTKRIEVQEIANWERNQKEAYCRIVIECQRMRGEAFLHEIYDYNQKYDISFTIEQFLEEESVKKEESAYPSGDSLAHEKMADALCRFYAMNLEQKGQAYYESHSFVHIQETQQTLVVESVLKACDALQRYGAQLVQKKENRIVLKEDPVTQLFCELYNAANSNWFNLNAANQRQMGTTGNWDGERKIPAELDTVICCADQIISVVEAFVLKEDTGRAIFKNHVGKAIGNNVSHAPLSIILLYGNAVDNDKAWKRYCEYLEDGLAKDICELKQHEVPVVVEQCLLEAAPYYAADIFQQYHGFRFVRHVVSLGSEKQEVLHIFVDVAKNAHSAIRKNM